MIKKANEGKVKFTFLLLLFFLLAVLSILSEGIPQKNNSKVLGTSLKDSNITYKELKSIEIYKYNPYKETAIEDYWHFSGTEALNFFTKAFYENASESPELEYKDTVYKIIINYLDGSRFIYPLWILDNYERILFQDGLYYLMNTEDSSRLRTLMENYTP